jgi:hypothetical protein
MEMPRNGTEWLGIWQTRHDAVHGEFAIMSDCSQYSFTPDGGEWSVLTKMLDHY